MRHNGEKGKINVRRQDPELRAQRDKRMETCVEYMSHLIHRKSSHVYNFSCRPGENGAEMIFEEEMAENFSVVKKCIKSQIQEAL